MTDSRIAIKKKERKWKTTRKCATSWKKKRQPSLSSLGLFVFTATKLMWLPMKKVVRIHEKQWIICTKYQRIWYLTSKNFTTQSPIYTNKSMGPSIINTIEPKYVHVHKNFSYNVAKKETQVLSLQVYKESALLNHQSSHFFHLTKRI